MSRNLAKDFHNLLRGIRKLSGDQASVCEWDPDDLSKFDVELAPSGGLYGGGKFRFTIDLSTNYPEYAPRVICKTPIYHPNIDTIGDSFDETNICVNTLDEWSEENDLDDIIQALLFLFYNPNLEDPLCPLICPDITDEEFQDNVKTFLEGGEVEEMKFETNYGFLENKTDTIENSTGNATDKETKLRKTNGNDNEQDQNENYKEMEREAAEVTVASKESVGENIRTEENPVEYLNGDKTLENVDSRGKFEIEKQGPKQMKTAQNENNNRYAFNILNFLPYNITSESTIYSTMSFDFQSGIYILDNLVPFNLLVSVMCTHFIRRMRLKM